ncbi:MAG: isopentenyl phosphate kinase family protein [Methanobrevibacter sp.]|jgi:isopentenyl phosphate kinase|nr:isopentenyl phosphate kinase family protein [Candidatus Methanovirga aequatorialis]
MIILKLGGSILTEKDSLKPKINLDNLNRIAIEIGDFLKDHDLKDEGLIIVHGAGSFGHPYAKKYRIGEPFPDSEYPKKRIGFSITHNSVNGFSGVISEYFIENDIPAISIPPSSIIKSSNKRISYFNLDLIKDYVFQGFLPVLYGDVVLDDTLKMTVISGDQILSYLAKNLIFEKVILATDVDGVFNKNPKLYDDAKLIKVLNSLEDLDSFDSTTNVDVTGGMFGKIQELIELADLGVESMIINAQTPSLIINALKGIEVKGTLIKSKLESFSG